MNNEFEKKIKDPNLSLIMDLSKQDKPLLVAFGGIVGELGIPAFEFFNITKDISVNNFFCAISIKPGTTRGFLASLRILIKPQHI